TSEQDRAPPAVRGGDPDDQRRGGDDPVVGAEHRRSKPTDAVRVVLLNVTRSWHGTPHLRAIGVRMYGFQPSGKPARHKESPLPPASGEDWKGCCSSTSMLVRSSRT